MRPTSELELIYTTIKNNVYKILSKTDTDVHLCRLIRCTEVLSDTQRGEGGVMVVNRSIFFHGSFPFRNYIVRGSHLPDRISLLVFEVRGFRTRHVSE